MSILKRALETEHVLKGRLYGSSSGWLLLTVPNSLANGIFESMEEKGIELPPSSSGKFNAHISVMRDEEVDEIGGLDEIKERGQSFSYGPTTLMSVEPIGWTEMERVWFLRVDSPELEELRKSYGLSALPEKKGKKLPFHITVAVRRKEESEKSSQLAVTEELGSIKDLSDNRHYNQKHALLRKLMSAQPNDWKVDSQGRMYGLTHVPTGYKFHAPSNIIPPGVSYLDKTAVLDLEKLLPELQSRKAQMLPIASLRGVTRSRRYGFSPVTKYPKVNVSKPVIADESGNVLDGKHRLLRLLDGGSSFANVITATEKDLKG